MFVNAFLAMCGIACGIPLLFMAHRLSRKYLPDSRNEDHNQRSVALMVERNELDRLKLEALRDLCKAATAE